MDLILEWGNKNNVTIVNYSIKEAKVDYVTTKQTNFIPNIRGSVNLRSVTRDLRVTPVSMNKDDIHNSIENFLSENQIKMLSTFKKVRDKIKIMPLHGFFKGYVGSVNVSIIINHMKKKERKRYYPQLNNFKHTTIDKLLKEKLLKLDLKLLSNYTHSEKPVRFEVLKGKYKSLTGTLLIQTLRRGYELSFQSLDDNSKQKYFNAYAESRGYQILKAPDDLLKTNRVTLRTPQGREWITVWSSFESGGRDTPTDTYTKSFGERMIDSILSFNNIKFKSEYAFTNLLGNMQLMDFYVELGTNKFCIEYHGEQHYRESEFFSNYPLKERIKLDQSKKDYCAKNNIVYIEIPYTCNTLKKVVDIMNEHMLFVLEPSHIDVLVTCSSSKVPQKRVQKSSDIIEYYKNNTHRDTVLTTGISARELNNICTMHGYSKKEGEFSNG